MYASIATFALPVSLSVLSVLSVHSALAAPSSTCEDEGGAATHFEPKGTATYYNLTSPHGDPGLTACGGKHFDSDFIVAAPHGIYDSYPGATLNNPNNNPICGKSMTVTLLKDGKETSKTVNVTVQDKCPSCDPGHIDLSPFAFEQLADEALGVINVAWGLD